MGRLNLLTIPMTLIWGRQDRFAAISLATELQRILPLTSYHEVDEASHAVFRDQPQQFAGLVRDFVMQADQTTH